MINQNQVTRLVLAQQNCKALQESNKKREEKIRRFFGMPISVFTIFSLLIPFVVPYAISASWPIKIFLGVLASFFNFFRIAFTYGPIPIGFAIADHFFNNPKIMDLLEEMIVYASLVFDLPQADLNKIDNLRNDLQFIHAKLSDSDFKSKVNLSLIQLEQVLETKKINFNDLENLLKEIESIFTHLELHPNLGSILTQFNQRTDYVAISIHLSNIPKEENKKEEEEIELIEAPSGFVSTETLNLKQEESGDEVPLSNPKKIQPGSKQF